MIKEGTAPRPSLVLERMAPLWETPAPDDPERAAQISGAFENTGRLLVQVLTDPEARDVLATLAETLRPFVERWRPVSAAHNDLHDDQIVAAANGKLALVDFEEAGAGDPLLDVANMIAHLTWMAHFGSLERCAAYRDELRAAARSLPWFDETELRWRVAYALFRLSSNGIMQAARDWPNVVASGLKLAAAALPDAHRAPAGVTGRNAFAASAPTAA